jgi:hypothetical protein
MDRNLRVRLELTTHNPFAKSVRYSESYLGGDAGPIDRHRPEHGPIKNDLFHR